MFRKINSLARLALLGTGTLVVIATYWEVLAGLDVVRTPLQLNEIIFRTSYLINFVVVMFACFAVCEMALKQYRPGIRAITGILVLLVVAAATTNFLGFPPQLWTAFILHHAPPIILVAACYILWLANQAWTSPFVPPPSGRRPEVLIGNVNSDLLGAKLGLDRKVATEITELHARANALMHRASAVLALIVVVLVSAAYFFYSAGDIAKSEIARIDPYTDLINESQDIGNRIGGVRSQLVRFSEMRIPNLERTMALSDRIEKLKETMESASQADSDDPDLLFRLSAELNHFMAQNKRMDEEEELLRSELAYLEQRREKIADERNEARKLVLSGDASPGSSGIEGSEDDLTASDLLIATGVTRFGVLIIAVYLVQILINLYRYNTRTAAYYRAHADALLLSNKNPKAMEALHKALVPDVDYGRLPRTVTQDVAARASDAVHRYWPGRGGPGRPS